MLIQQQQAKINELVSKAQVEKIQMMAEENNINLLELDSILQPIIDTCTKDSISSGMLSNNIYIFQTFLQNMSPIYICFMLQEFRNIKKTAM